MGKIVPPIEEPHATIPNAKPLRFLNQCEMTAGVEPNMNPEDSYMDPGSVRRQRLRVRLLLTPTAKPWQSRKCQYFVH